MLPVYSSQKTGVFNQRRAFKGSITYLGKTGALDTQGVIDRILAQPSTAPFIADQGAAALRDRPAFIELRDAARRTHFAAATTT